MVLIQLGLGRLRRSQPGHGFAELGGSRRHGRPTSVVDTGIRAPNSELEPGTASSAAPGPAQHQVSAARWIASRKLPNRRRIVFSDGRIAASVQLSAVGSEPCSATNSRRAATDSSIRVSATSDRGTASPSNTPGGFVLWNLGPPALSSCATLEHYGPPLDADRTQHSAWRPGILFETPANLIG